MTEECFVSAYKRNSQRLFLIALSFTKSHTDSEDILQNVFCKLLNYKGVFEDDVHMDKWLTVVCVNESKNHIKSFFRKNVTSLDEAKELYTFDNVKDFSLFEAVMSLPKNERIVVHLFYYEDMAIKDIANILHISESAVKTRLSRARQHLKLKLGEDWENE